MQRTAEVVAAGHPDKLCDQISDAILDKYLETDPYARVAVETLATASGVILAGEATSTATVNRAEVAQRVLSDAGYPDYSHLPVVDRVVAQSAEIGAAVADGGAGDQGIMFGYATNETPEMLPLPLVLARDIRDAVAKLGWHPDHKAQVTVRYRRSDPVVDRVVVSACHPPELHQYEVEATLKGLVLQVLDDRGVPHRGVIFQMQPGGPWTRGGPSADSGLTGRKIVVDTYGGFAPHGGGAFSGKDPSKVDRSGAYAARWVAKNIVAAGLAEEATVELAYAIGVREPLALRVDTHGTGVVGDAELERVVNQVFDLTVPAIIRDLGLRSQRYKRFAAGGHFGVEGALWESTDAAPWLRAAVEQ